ncbi:hypothetical protein Hs30E_01270 [Lactococcus hodotermopsidis]|uniref:DUF5105 domain-containing protein n=1 Tax=Pseudolactococcus hodotermopsidis TaxID=2709157 RepID=A0A6A0B9W0_9LACT|nr:hypothetical protein [Lactococcus hodotermopsidis]GFH41576.1 hypothetical protein Hs30E_01270 [Lactococcus hodotermopsidis]
MKTRTRDFSKKLGLVFIALFAALTLVACGFSESDATDYVKSSLDAFTKGDLKEYAKITNQTEKAAQTEYDEGINSILTTFDTTGGLSDSRKEEFRSIIIDVVKLSKYDVMSAEKTDKGFSVKVKIKPFTGLETLEDEMMKKLTPEAIAESGVNVEDNAAMLDWVTGIIVDLIKESIANPEYGNAKEMTVEVIKKDKQYNLSNSDMEKLIAAMLVNK